MTTLYFLKQAARGLMALTIVSVALPGCGGDNDTNTGSTLSADLRLGAMSNGQRETFCRWVTEPSTVCEQASNPDQTPAKTKTPLQVCLDSFTMLPDCIVAQYQACLDEAKKDACGAAAASACQELMTCPGMRLRTGVGMSADAAGAVCATEIGFGIGAIVWEIRRSRDDWHHGDMFNYCIDYSRVCDHWNWQEGCICYSWLDGCHGW